MIKIMQGDCLVSYCEAQHRAMHRIEEAWIAKAEIRARVEESTCKKPQG